MDRTRRHDCMAATIVTMVIALTADRVSAQPANDPRLAEQIRSLVDPLAAKKQFAGIVLIERSDGTRTLEVFGDADVESGVPVALDTRF